MVSITCLFFLKFLPLGRIVFYKNVKDIHQKRGELRAKRQSWKKSKKNWKNLKKRLDKKKSVWYTNRASRKGNWPGRAWILENWTTEFRKNTKQNRERESERDVYKCVRNLVKTHWELKKVKEAKTIALKNDWMSEGDLAYWIQFFREFDPGSGWTLAACITHSSRTDSRNTVSGGRVSNAWAICLCVWDNREKSLLIPHDVAPSHGGATKDLSHRDERASD